MTQNQERGERRSRERREQQRTGADQPRLEGDRSPTAVPRDAPRTRRSAEVPAAFEDEREQRVDDAEDRDDQGDSLETVRDGKGRVEDPQRPPSRSVRFVRIVKANLPAAAARIRSRSRSGETPGRRRDADRRERRIVEQGKKHRAVEHDGSPVVGEVGIDVRDRRRSSGPPESGIDTRSPGHFRNRRANGSETKTSPRARASDKHGRRITPRKERQASRLRADSEVSGADREGNAVPVGRRRSRERGRRARRRERVGGIRRPRPESCR